MSTLLATRPRAGRRLRRAPIVLSIAAPAVFLALHLLVVLRTLAIARAQEVAEGWPLDPRVQTIVGGIGSDVLQFAALALAGVVLARLGYRVLWGAPALIGVFGYAIGAPHLPGSIGSEWFLVGAPRWFAHPWVAATTDVVLCLAVALPFLSSPRRVRTTPTAADVLAILAVVVVAAITLRTAMVVDNTIPAPPILGAIAAFGLLAGTARPWPLTIAAVALGVGGTLGAVLWTMLPPIPGAGDLPPVADQMVSAALEGVPLVVCGVVLSSWERLPATMTAVAKRPAVLLVVVIALNVADAVLTQFAVRSGAAVELNPVVRTIGLPAKVILVGLLSWFLYRRRPAALLIPAAILLVVLAYHVSGLVIDG